MQIPIVTATTQQPLEQTNHFVFDEIFLFSIMLLCLLITIYIKRRKRIVAAVASILGFASYLFWFYTSILWIEYYNINLAEQRTIAIVLWVTAMIVLITKSARKQKRKIFTEAVKREVIHRQKGKCAICKRKLQSYGLDFHHKNEDGSNNKISNCQVLCTLCHRKRHSVV
jgi:K+-sensing histidine kinase KdpD